MGYFVVVGPGLGLAARPGAGFRGSERREPAATTLEKGGHYQGLRQRFKP
jgi:hypothetical protein